MSQMLPPDKGFWRTSDFLDMERVEDVKGRGNSTQYLVKLSSREEPIWIKGPHMDRQDLVKEFQKRKNRERQAGQRQRGRVSSQLQEAAVNTPNMYNYFPVVNRSRPSSQQQQQSNQYHQERHHRQQIQSQQHHHHQQQQQQQQQMQVFSQQLQPKKRSNIAATDRDVYSQPQAYSQMTSDVHVPDPGVAENEEFVPNCSTLAADHRPKSESREQQHASTLEWLAKNQEYLCQQFNMTPVTGPIEAVTMGDATTPQTGTPDLDCTCAICRETSLQENLIRSACGHLVVCNNCAHILYLSLFAHDCLPCKALMIFFLSTFSLCDLIKCQLSQDVNPLID